VSATTAGGPSTAEAPWPVRRVSREIKKWVERLGSVWVEGQLVQVSRRPGAKMAFAVLRDVDEDFSLPLTMFAAACDPAAFEEGARVVVNAKPAYWLGRGSLQLQVREIRRVGVGDLLARIEKLKRALAAEGLFAPERKRPVPPVPDVIGLICGRESKAEHDVVVGATARWPLVRFAVREVAVQGHAAVGEVGAALVALDADPAVDVIVIARGGGAVEDLLPFSDETLVRAVAAARTPVVSAIGHETDAPLLDLAADLRASTPTDAAKRIVPDWRAELDGLERSRARMRSGIGALLGAEQARLDAVRARAVLASPDWIVAGRAADVAAQRADARAALARTVEAAAARSATLAAELAALSPKAVLARGYAVVRAEDGRIVRAPGDIAPDAALAIRVAGGELAARRTD
jgi:exodeoxyribonuclease VII large subunit